MCGWSGSGCSTDCVRIHKEPENLRGLLIAALLIAAELIVAVLTTAELIAGGGRRCVQRSRDTAY